MKKVEEAFVLDYGFLYSQDVQRALEKLFGSYVTGDLVKKLYSLQKHYNKEFRNLKIEFQELVKKHSKTNEKGEVLEPQGPGSFSIKDDEIGEWNRAVAELMRKQFEVKNFSKINLESLFKQGVMLSANDITYLEPVLTGLDFSL